MAVILIAILLSIAVIPAYAVKVVVTPNIFYAPTDNNTLQPYLELYWEIDPTSISYQQQDSVWSGSIETSLTLSNETDTIHTDIYLLRTSPAAKEALYSKKILELKRITVPPGNIQLQLTLKDRHTGTTYEFSEQVTVDTVALRPFFSDIQLVDTLIAALGYEQHIFYRNGYLQFPISGNFIDDHRNRIRYYAELYQTPLLSAEEILIRKVFISRKELEAPVHELIHTDTLVQTQPVLTEGFLSTATLPSGNYYLNMTLENGSGTRLAYQQVFFQLINTHPEAPVARPVADSTKEDKGPVYLNLQKTFVAKYTMPQVRAILKMLLPVASQPEKKTIHDFIRKPDDMYSRYFIYNFWLSRNKSNPEKSWKAYAEQVKEVNKLFGSRSRPGYETDRGMIYLKYGKPTERIIVLNEQGTLPYEIWQYNVMEYQANGIFLFYLAGLMANDFQLLHTTVSGEMRNRTWRNSLYTGSSGGDPRSSRAEQYIGNQ